MHKLRAGVIGVGFMGSVHAQAVRTAGHDLVAVAGSTPERSAQAVERLGASRAATVEDLLASDDIDVVHVCTPNATHHSMALSALRAGKAVVCEKPLATTVEDAHELVTEAARAQRLAVVPFVYRFHPMVREARQRVRDDEVGDITMVHGSYLQDWLASPTAGNWRVDATQGGQSRAFADIGVHWCDLAEFVTGHRITRLTARAQTVHPHRDGIDGPVTTEDCVALIFETERGAFGTAVISQISYGRKNRLWLQVDATRKSLSFDQENPEALWVADGEQTRLVRRAERADQTGASPYSFLPVGHVQGYQDAFDALIRDTYQSVNGEQHDGLPLFSDGLRASLLTDAVLTSSRTGAWVEVPPP